jgi:hypothetical protein
MADVTPKMIEAWGIAMDLAEADAPFQGDDLTGPTCALCPEGGETAEKGSESTIDYRHEPECIWWRAVQWHKSGRAALKESTNAP